MEKSLEEYENDNSLPKLPDLSIGSSVSTDLENEFEDLVQYAFVLPPRINDDDKEYENVKNSFNVFQIIQSETKDNDDLKVENLDIIETNQENNTGELKNSLPENNSENSNTNEDLEVEIKLEEEIIQEALSESTKSTTDFKLQIETSNFGDQIQTNNKNSLTVVSDLIETITEEEGNKSPSVNFKSKLDRIEETKPNMDSSFSPCTSGSCSSNISNQEIHLMKQYFNDYNPHFDNSNDANPRKNSPIPASPPTNIDLENEASSLEHLSSLNNQNYESCSAFRKINNDNITNNNANKILQTNCITTTRSNSHNSNQHNEQNKNLKIANCLDKWYKELKGQVLSEFEKSRVQIFQEQQKKLLEEKEKQTIEITKLKKEIDVLKETIKINEKNILKKDEAIENLTKAFEKQREKNELQRVMMEWKLKRLENARETFTTKLADKYYFQRLKLKSFLNWQCFLNSKHKIKVEKACKKKAEEICYDLATKYENKIKKLEEELNLSKLEIEKYKLEMAKNEENMKKALMRGVCALNLEAMSIFNENSPVPNLNENQFMQQNEFFNLPSSVCQANSYQEINLSQKLNDKELARKVKNYCEANLTSKKNNTTNNMSSLAKAKMQLLNSNAKNNNENQNQNEAQIFNNDQEQQNPKFLSNNKMFDELTEHHLIFQPKTSNKHLNAKSKIGSLPANKNSNSLHPSQLSTTMPPYRSVIIEKHTSNNQQLNNEDINFKTTTTKVKYTPPNQPAKVLNTVISTSIS